MTDPTSDFLALFTEMADELDRCRRFSRGNCDLTHPLADRARSALPQLEVELPERGNTSAPRNEAMTISPEAKAWLHQSAAVDGFVSAQILLNLLERVEALEQWLTRGDFVQVPPTPEVVPAASDEELLAMRSWSSHGPTFDSDLVEFGRSCYDLGRQRGAAQPPAAQPTPPVAPAGGLVERVVKVIADPDGPAELWYDDARAAIREVAAWMRENETGYNAARPLEQEADR